MLRKIVIALFISVICCIFASYFIFVAHLRTEDKKLEICKDIHVTILDSAENRFISKADVSKIIRESEQKPIGQNFEDINVFEIEQLLNRKSVIRNTDAALSSDGILHVNITQRRPILRIETPKGGFYIDDEMFAFPLTTTFSSYIPIVTGHIPLNYEQDYKGQTSKKNQEWLKKIMQLGSYIEKDEFLNAQIQEIHIEENQDVSLYTRIGDQKIIFGELDRFQEKFEKLMTYYENIVPVQGWNRYSEINLKFMDQIVCTRKKEK